MTLRINVLGGLNVERGGQPLTGAAAQPRRLAILALLARADDRGVTRDRVMSLLWPDVDEDRARRALTQALYALRQDLGDDDAIAGVKELRLDFDHVSTDVRDFTLARSRDALEDAAAMYRGPFLEGFHLQGADEFGRWADTERRVLAREHITLLEQLALRTESQGDAVAAAGWWHRLAALDPLNARTTVSLMHALVAAGDARGAIQQARVHEALVEQHLDLPPDREVIALAARLRREARRQSTEALASIADAAAQEASAVALLEAPDAEAGAPAAREDMLAESAPPSAIPAEPNAEPPSSAPAEAAALGFAPVPGVETPSAAVKSGSRVARRWWPAAAAAGALIVLAGAAIAVAKRWRAPHAVPDQPVVVVGRITDYAGLAERGAGTPLVDMLATNLARAPGLRVMSSARLDEVVERLTSQTRDTTAGVVIRAAREAGATDLIDGAVYRTNDGRLRLDLQRVDLASGAVLHAYTVEGADVFALADSGSLRIVRHLGTTLPPGSLADVTTHSAVAYRYYAEGLRAFSKGDVNRADSLFLAALREDSTFAMAWYYHANTMRGPRIPAFARALALSGAVSERERLIIRADWAYANSSPSSLALAESLATRYPAEIEGSLYVGRAMVGMGKFLEGIPVLQQVLDADPAGLRGSTVVCAACAALASIVSAYLHADSAVAAERETRRWIALQGDSPLAWAQLGGVLEVQNRLTEASEAYATAARLGPATLELWPAELPLYLRRGDFAGALAITARHANTSPDNSAWWTVTILRHAGRLGDAIAAAQRRRAAALPSENPPGIAIQLAQTFFEAGQFDSAAVLFDAQYRTLTPGADSSVYGRNRAWMLTHVADALAGKGDTARLALIADSVRVLGALSAYGRDPLLHHHARGLLLRARGDERGAASEFRAAIWSPTFGFTRSNLELARSLLTLGRAREAVAALQPALRGPVEASNLYITLTELHEALAHAWDAAGRPDSAAVHYEYVARTWAHADPPFAARAARAGARVNALRSPQPPAAR